MPEIEATLLRRADLEARLNLSRCSIAKLVQSGDLPPPVKIGERCYRWRVADIERWERERETDPNWGNQGEAA